MKSENPQNNILPIKNFKILFWKIAKDAR